MLAWVVAALLIAWTIVRTFGLERGFPLVPLLAYTPYVVVAAALAAGLALLLARRTASVVIAACAVILLVQVAPRSIPEDAPDPAPEGPQLRVLSVNMLAGGAEIEPIEGLIDELRVDVVSFSELTPGAARLLQDSGVGDVLPYSALDARLDSAGTGLFSRYPLRRMPAPGKEGTDAPSVVATVDAPGGSAEVWSIHPTPPTGPTAVGLLDQYLEAIPPASSEGPPRVLVGDFNATLDNASLRDVVAEGYTDAADARGAGLVPTWPGGLWPPPVTIDHVIADERAAVLKYETAELIDSDHRAVFAELRLPGIEPGTFGPLPAED